MSPQPRRRIARLDVSPRWAALEARLAAAARVPAAAAAPRAEDQPAPAAAQ